MHIPVSPARRRHMEDELRALGAVLDTVRARGVFVREADGGLIVRAQVTTTVGDRLDDRWTSLEREYRQEDIVRLQREAVGRRGSGHQAGPHERALRMIGQLIDKRELRAVTLIQHVSEGGWLLWHQDTLGGRPALLVLEDDELLIQDAEAAEAREARAPTTV